MYAAFILPFKAFIFSFKACPLCSHDFFPDVLVDEPLEGLEDKLIALLPWFSTWHSTPFLRRENIMVMLEA